MQLTFQDANRMYQSDRISELSQTEAGRRFLFLRSLSRTEYLQRLAATNNININGVGSRNLFSTLFNSPISVDAIKVMIKTIFQDERSIRAEQEPNLINELYKLKEFYWGGLHQNSLEKTIVDNYVKKIANYDELNTKIDNELYESMRGYVRCSWYNHWTSIVIEDIFKAHRNVLPAVGLVKKIDFFIRAVPFDLKVTYLPEGYVKDMRRKAELRPELTLLKQAARARHLAIDATLRESELLEHMWNVIADQPDEGARAVVAELKTFRINLVNHIGEDPTQLIKWLYENQGERRFDASNRLFLVLVNESNFFQSWQLKRNRTLLSNQIDAYLDNAAITPGRNIEFVWEGNEYNTRADAIIVRHISANN